MHLPQIKKNYFSSFHLFVIKIKDDYADLHKLLFNYLRNNKINVNLHYIPVHLHPYYKNLGFKKGNFKFSEKHALRAISIPIYPSLRLRKIKKYLN